MSLTIQWRVKPESDTILIVKDGVSVLVAIPVEAQILSRALTVPGDLTSWQGGKLIEAVDRDPEIWGDLVIERNESGQIVNMDPEAFWNGVYDWFRSRGVDYDSFAS
jgi:hypothetical protein